MPTYYDAWLTYCRENNIALPEWEGDKAWEFLEWMCRENSYALRKFIPTPAPKAEPQEIDGLSAGGRLLGLSGKAHTDTGEVRVAQSKRAEPQEQSEVCETCNGELMYGYNRELICQACHDTIRKPKEQSEVCAGHGLDAVTYYKSCPHCTGRKPIGVCDAESM